MDSRQMQGMARQVMGKLKEMLRRAIFGIKPTEAQDRNKRAKGTSREGGEKARDTEEADNRASDDGMRVAGTRVDATDAAGPKRPLV